MENYNDSFTEVYTGESNMSDLVELPIDMKFNDGHLLAIILYTILMVISASGNISVLCVILRLRLAKGRMSRISLLLLHLAIADLLVTFLMMPLEIIWNATVSWRAGDLMCRLMSFARIFGLYLSGFLLICISVDRYFAIVKPLTISIANTRVHKWLLVAWLSSGICSFPQVYIFHVEAHPVFTWYEQCVTFNSFPDTIHEMLYNFFGFLFLYGLPLITIVTCYGCILLKIYRISRQNENESLRRSNMGSLSRAKMKTVKMTITIVATFFLCWTPYNVMSLWYWFDKSSAIKVDQKIQKGLFLFACTNSCVNPIIYGYFHFRRSKSGQSRNLPYNQQTECSRTGNELNGIQVCSRQKTEKYFNTRNLELRTNGSQVRSRNRLLDSRISMNHSSVPV